MDLEITGRVFPPGWMKWDTSEMYDSVVLLVLVRMQQWLRFGHSSRPLPRSSTLRRLLLTNYDYLLLYGALTTTDSTLSSLLFPLFIFSLSLSLHPFSIFLPSLPFFPEILHFDSGGASHPRPICLGSLQPLILAGAPFRCTRIRLLTI